jgi:hypothetical protein
MNRTNDFLFCLRKRESIQCVNSREVNNKKIIHFLFSSLLTILIRVFYSEELTRIHTI